MPKQRGTSMSTGMHVDPGMVLDVDDLDEDDSGDVPPGAVRFSLEAEEIAEALAAPSTEVGSPRALAWFWLSCLRSQQPSIVPLSANTAKGLRAMWGARASSGCWGIAAGPA